MSSTQPRTVVVGGGIIGVSTARHLARAGADVTLITEGELTSNASGRSLSWLNSAGVRSEEYHRLRMAGIDRYRTLAARHPGLGWLRFDGGLAWQAPEHADDLHRIHEHELAHGYDSHVIDPSRVADYTPGVDPAAISPAGAIWNPGEGWVDLPHLAQHLIKEFVEHGGRLVTNAGPARVETAGGSVSRVRTAEGESHAADTVVLATGPAVPAMAAELGVAIPDQTPISLLVTTKPVDTPLRAVLNTPRAAVRPAPHGALAVDSDWTTAGIRPTADGGFAISDEIVAELLAEASRLLAGNPRLEPERLAMGPKPIPGDGDPVLGRVDEVGGLWAAFTHSGATLALIAGELLAYEISTGRAHPMLAPFNARRFR
ncbi:NAD(P)/FAD-dependent oxidoreductase [Nonomuraea jabiensis]|uniref:Glycine/D-amino acid oxidase-like deaminating enzyme n=1 Tax=Nonomuraea jabiensis TaxID=882448 RepID=A0A7W9FYQ4_9ACTN|nr:FAD-binding oxidoreductase [Nonomuraea jabiensis]MBB5773949.1 glycine/D-amino acid oxidase-like deaminating enzyme [Nonomuraea jabiensis]